MADDDETQFDALLVALEDADGRVRALYRRLAEDPDLAVELDAELHALRETRRHCAEKVGLAALALRRSLAMAEASPRRESSPAIEADAPVIEIAVDAVSVAPAPEPELEPEPEPAVPPEPPLSTEAIAAWTESALANGIGQTAYADRYREPWELTLERLLSDLGAPRELEHDLAGELDALNRVSDDERLHDWVRLPREVQQAWLGILVARTRAVKSLQWLTMVERARVKTIIDRYPRWARTAQPGHVNGLRKDHEPKSSSWAQDARQLWTSLVAMTGEEETPAPKATKPLRPQREPRAESAESAESDDDDRFLEPDWRLWPLVRARHAILAGGDPREPNRARLERAFQLASLEWPDISKPRRVSSLLTRLRQRNVDLVIVLAGFVDHKHSEPIIEAAKDAGIAWAVADGYGAASIKLALERYLAVPS